MHPNTMQRTKIWVYGPMWRIRCVCCKKIPVRLRVTHFFINCTSSPYFSSSFMELRNDPKCTQTVCNAPKHEFGGPMGLIGCVRCEISRRDFVARTFALIAPVHPILHRVSGSYEMIPNAPKQYATHQSISSGVQWGWLGVFVAKDPDVTSWHEFCINCTSSPCFASSLMQLRNYLKCTQTLYNAPKHEFTVQWGGLGAFVVTNPDVTSWHKLLY
jgi:hypothetical protein